MYIFSLIHALLCGTYFPEALSNLQNKKVQVFNYCTALYVRWPSVPYFPGQSRFLKTSPGKKTVLLECSCRIFGLLSRICFDLPISAAVCLCIGGQKLASILSVYTKTLLAAGAPPETTLGDLTTLLQIPKLDPQRLTSVAHIQRFVPSALIPDCGAQIMVTLYIRAL